MGSIYGITSFSNEKSLIFNKPKTRKPPKLTTSNPKAAKARILENGFFPSHRRLPEGVDTKEERRGCDLEGRDI